ncbi:ATP-dependent DNA helicase PIF1 [Hevea brasiliensis]|uniref:ATP-dependent DNA helicase PIF1 n=1 Tax=Hevea brasiliensis TaxID=3981 RepID=UPI0025DDB06E|nr:ATP-dependent DNA helicase PIF1 [Hevea brasiliensis]
MGLNFFKDAIAVYRTFSTKTSRISKTTRRAQSGSNKNKKKSRESRIKWTEEQNDVLNHVRCGLSVFITGSAGTGKSVLLKRIIDFLKKVNGSSGVFVTASTGVAACALNGRTLHSFAGIGIGNDDYGNLLERVLMSSRACNRWRKVNALIIDEISVISANMFENLESIAREMRGSQEVWGGIQLIVSGDFFQLPPVSDKCNSSGKEFAFEADCWDASFDVQVELTEVFRQSDAEQIKLLQRTRKGMIYAEDLQILEQCCPSNEPDSSVVSFYPRNEDVNKVNEERLRSLGEKVVVYKAADGGLDNQRAELKQGIAPDQLELCNGARVMLIKNLNVWRNLCNGATGTVTGFVEPEDKYVLHLSPDNLLPVVKFDSGPEMVVEPQVWEILEGGLTVAWRSQIPLHLAWAQSVHKSQGMTLDRLHTDLSRSFGYGMVYVILSRVRTLKGLYLSGFNPSMIKAHPKVLHFYESLAGEEQYKEDENNSKILDHSDKSSIAFAGKKCKFSLSEFLLSRQHGQ